MGHRVTFLPFMLSHSKRAATLKLTYQSHSSPGLSERRYVLLVLMFIFPISHSSEYQFMLNMLSQFMQKDGSACAASCSWAKLLAHVQIVPQNVAVHALNYSKCYLLCVGWEKETFFGTDGHLFWTMFLQICLHIIDFYHPGIPWQMRTYF